MRALILVSALAIAGCDSNRPVDRDYSTNVPAENEVIIEENEAREPAPEGDERPR